MGPRGIDELSGDVGGKDLNVAAIESDIPTLRGEFEVDAGTDS